MTMLQQQTIQIIDDMPDDKLQTLIDLMKMLIKSDHDADSDKDAVSKRIGAAVNRDMYDPDYDIDEYNTEIAKMFGVTV